MKGVQLTGHGGLENLVYREDLEEPVPGPADVLVRVGAAGINNTDVWTREGAYGAQDDPTKVQGWRREALSFPRIQGADVVGRIAAVGADVSTDRVGERVLVDPALYTANGDGLLDAGIIGSERDGGFAELVAVPADNAHTIESSLSDAQLASFPTAYVTAERMLRRARVGEGDTLLVTGASGGVGTGVVQLAKLRGAWVVAVVGAGKEPLIREIGADAVIPARRWALRWSANCADDRSTSSRTSSAVRRWASCSTCCDQAAVMSSPVRSPARWSPSTCGRSTSSSSTSSARRWVTARISRDSSTRSSPRPFGRWWPRRTR